MQKPSAEWGGSMPAPTCITFPKWGFPRPSAAGKYIAGSSQQVPPTAFGTCSILPKTWLLWWLFSANSGASRGLSSAIPPSRATSKVQTKNVLPKTLFVLLRFSFSYPFSLMKSVKLSSSITLFATRYWRTFSIFTNSLSVCSRSCIVRVSFIAPQTSVLFNVFKSHHNT